MKAFAKSFGTKFFAVLLSILLSSPYAFAGDVGRITYVEGRVDISRPNSEIATPVREGDAISVGDAVRTKSNSKAEVTFGDNTVLRLAQNSKVGITEYQLDENNKRKTATINLERGKARSIIAKMPDAADFIISTPNAEGRVKGSDIFTFYQAGNSGMLVADGRLSVINTAHPENSIIVPTGNSVLVPLEELPKGPRAYFDLEKKLHEQDTSVPISRREQDTVIRGATTKVSGKVSITTKGATAPHDASINEILNEGDKIETGNNGLIEIKFDNGNAINLKQNTNLLMGRLVFDPATGEYENLFESNAGEIRARIENLKGKSKFEVKTPTAVCGARGTIMYLFILPSLTTSFFEGGGGYLNNLVSGINKILDAGQNASADSQGNVSDPGYTSDADREAYGEGWDPGSGTEGYSAPEGATGEYLFEPDTGADTDAGGGADAPETGGGAGGEPFDDLPPTETGILSGGDGTTPPPTEEPLFVGVFGAGSDGEDGEGGFGYYDISQKELKLDNGEISGSLEGTESLWTGSPQVTIDGTYSNDGNHKLWGADLLGVTSDGLAVFSGTMGGTNLNDELKGILRAFYIRANPDNPDEYLTGYIKSSNITGGFDPGTSTFEATGNLTSYLDLPIDISDINVSDVVEGSNGDGSNEGDDGFFEGEINGDISGTINGESAGLPGQKWDLWRAGGGGAYNAPLPNEWNALMRGWDRNNNENQRMISGGWIGSITGNRAPDGGLSGKTFGVTVDYKEGWGIFVGDLIGRTYTGNPGNEWEALSAGAWLNEELIRTLETQDRLPEEFKNLDIRPFSGEGLGAFKRGNDLIGDLTADDVSGVMLNTNDRTSGVWGMTIKEGTHSDPKNSWTLALGVAPSNENGAYCLGTIDGNKWSGGELGGGFDAIWLAFEEDGTIKAGTMSGDVKGGYIEISEGPGRSGTNAGTWQAVGLGEWVEVTNLLTEDLVGFNRDDFDEFISVPITETQSVILNGNGANSFFTDVTMNMRIFKNEAGDWIWLAPIDGNHAASGNPVDTILTVTKDNDIMNLIIKSWENLKFTAVVGDDSNVVGNIITGGFAGTYDDTSFAAIGTGIATPEGG